MKKEQISCFATLSFLRLQMTSGIRIGNWGFCSFVNRTPFINRRWGLTEADWGGCEMLNTLSPGGFTEDLQIQAWCFWSYASSCILLKTFKMTADTRINWETHFKFASEFPCSGRGQQEDFPFNFYAWEKYPYHCHVVTTNLWFCFKMWSMRRKASMLWNENCKTAVQ